MEFIPWQALLGIMLVRQCERMYSLAARGDVVKRIPGRSLAFHRTRHVPEWIFPLEG
jgi:hypothetical protein